MSAISSGLSWGTGTDLVFIASIILGALFHIAAANSVRLRCNARSVRFGATESSARPSG